MKALRIALSVLAGAILLFVIVAVIFIRTFDLNDYKDRISAYVEQRTGRTLVIEDDIEFSLFPWFAVETGRVSLSDDPDFGDRSFLTAEALSARVRVWPLLRRQIEIGRVILDGITLNLEIDEAGRGNWATLLESPAREVPAAAGTRAPERPTINALAVEGIELNDARVFWHDASGEVAYLVRDLTLVTGPVENDNPVTVSASFSVLDVASQTFAEFELESEAVLRPAIALDGTSARVRVVDARGQERASATIEADSISLDQDAIRSGPANAAGVVRRLPVGPDAFAFESGIGSAVLDRTTGTLAIDGLTMDSGGVRARLDLRGTDMLSDPRLTGMATLESGGIGTFFAALGLEPPIEFGQDTGGIVAVLEFETALAARAATISRYAISALGADATGQAELGTDGSLTADIDVPAFRPNDALTGSLGTAIPDGIDLTQVASARLAAALTFDSASGRLEIGEYSIGIDAAAVQGSLAIDDIRARERIDGTVTATGLDNRLLAALFGPWLPEGLVDAELGDFRLATDFIWLPENQTTEFAPLALDAYGLAGDGQLLISYAGGALGLSGRAEIAEFSPRALFERFDLPVPQSADTSVLRAAEFAASFDATSSGGKFRDIAITLDNSRITGEFSVENFSDPAYAFVLRADRIDVDRYLPPREATDAATGTGNNERVLGGMRLASESMTGTVVSGTASVGRLTIGGMDFSQLSTELALGDGRAALSSVRTNLYGGSFEGGLSIDATGEAGYVNLTGNTTNVAIEPLLNAMLGSAHISGNASFVLDLTGRGDTINEVLQSAAGSLDFSLTNGEIDGTNLGFELCKAVNAVRSLRAPAASPDSTAFSVIRGSAVVSDGIATSSDLYATTGYLELTGRGRSRIVDQWIDHRYRAALTGPIPIAGCEDVNRSIANDPVPINFGLTGSFPDIEFNVDRSQLLEDWARREARERVEERLQDAILDRIFN